MKTKLCLNDGVGVEVKNENGTFYYFYENFKNDDGMDRAYRHFNNGEKLTFYSSTWAKQTQFKEYMELYKNMVQIADTAEKEMLNDYTNAEKEAAFDAAYKREFDYLMFLCEKLIEWTKCDFHDAKKQIITQQIKWLSF